MIRALSRPTFFLASFAACALMAVSSGCASGGFKLTRQLAGWVNSQHIVIRVIIYVLAGVLIFGVTVLIDSVIFNTMDFWEGRVSQGDYLFKQGEREYHVKHEVLPESQLRRSTIEIKDLQGKSLQVQVLAETATGEIEFTVDGVKKAVVKDLKSLPTAAIYNERGELEREVNVLASMPLSAMMFARK